MKKQIIPYTTHAEWLAARLQDITSTESAALFGVSPYVTPFELYHAKKSGEVEQLADNPRMRWGRRLQDTIAQGVADNGVHIRKMTEYVRDCDARIGASFDFQIIGADHSSPLVTQFASAGAAVMEIKTVDPFEFKASWLIEDGDAIEAPPHIELQVQHQLLVSGMQWALIVALVGGNRVSVIERKYDPVLGAAIMQKALEFWQLVERGTPPSPDYSRDADIISRIYANATDGKVLDATTDDALDALAYQYDSLGDEVRKHTKQREAVRARILERIGDAQRVLLPHESHMSANTVRESLVPAFTRAAHRTIRVTYKVPT